MCIRFMKGSPRHFTSLCSTLTKKRLIWSDRKAGALSVWAGFDGVMRQFEAVWLLFHQYTQLFLCFQQQRLFSQETQNKPEVSEKTLIHQFLSFIAGNKNCGVVRGHLFHHSKVGEPEDMNPLCFCHRLTQKQSCLERLRWCYGTLA